MRKYYQALLEQFHELHAGCRKAVEALPLEALDWAPGPEMNSLSVLITHLTGAERYWIGDVVKGEPSFRDRDAEFQVSGVEAEALKARLDKLDAFEEAVLETLRLRDLDTWKVSPRDGRKVTIAWGLLHALQHTAAHVGHIEILVQLWKEQEKTRG